MNINIITNLTALIKMEEYLLKEELPIAWIVCGLILLIIYSKILSIITRNDEYSYITNLFLIIVVITMLAITDAGFSQTFQSRDEKFISNVWDTLIRRQDVPDLKVVSISDDPDTSRFKITLVNDDVYFVPYERVKYDTLRFSYKAYKKTQF